MPKNFVGEPFCAVFQNTFGIEKNYREEGVGIRIFRRKFFVSWCQKNVGEPISVSLFLGVVKLYASEGSVTIFCRTFFVSQCRKFRRRPLYFLINFGERKLLGIREGVIHFFRSKTFWLTEPKKFVGGPFFVSQNFWYRKNSWRRGRGVSEVSVGSCLSHFAEKFRRGNLLCFTKFRVSKKLGIRGGAITILRRKRFCLTVPKIS